MGTKTHIYDLEKSANEILKVTKDITEDGLKESMSLNRLEYMDESDLKMLRSVKTGLDAFEDMTKAYVEYLKSMDERMTKIEDTLREINRKLDRINSK